MLTKFSILIPAYKVDFLEECIASVVSQTFNDFELIIVNDASPYDLDSIVAKFEDPRIRYYKNSENLGKKKLVDNWNKCLSYATGEYVLNMGDDDRLLPACLQICATLIARHPRLEVYHIRKEIINEKGEIVGLQEDRPDVESVYSMMWHSWKGRNQILAEWLYKTSSLKERGGYYNLPLAWGSDDLTAYIAAQDKGVANTHIPGVQYRVSQVSITSSCRTGDTMQKCEALDKLVAYYKTFLKKEPQNDMDKKYRHFISLELDSIFEAGKGKLIENNLTASLSNIIYWLKVRKRLKVTDRFLLSCFLRAVKAILFH